MKINFLIHNHAGALELVETVSAGRAAFTVAGVLAFGAVLGTLFVSKPRTTFKDSEPATDAAGNMDGVASVATTLR